MSAKWQRVKIDIPEHLTPIEREALALEILDFIRIRTKEKNLDKNNRPFPGYSKSYVKSLDFKIAGKSKGRIDLTLSGDMLGALDLLGHKKGELVLGFENGTPENARADGNIRGTYGKPKGDPSKARDFLGITPKDLTSLLKNYPKQKDNSAYAESVINVAKDRANVEIDGDFDEDEED